jgi:hypothetical protein
MEKKRKAQLKNSEKSEKGFQGFFWSDSVGNQVEVKWKSNIHFHSILQSSSHPVIQ